MVIPWAGWGSSRLHPAPQQHEQNVLPLPGQQTCGNIGAFFTFNTPYCLIRFEKGRSHIVKTTNKLSGKADAATEKKKRGEKKTEKKPKSPLQKINPNQIKSSKPPSWT